jgi:cardiolipin synthase C
MSTVDRPGLQPEPVPCRFSTHRRVTPGVGARRLTEHGTRMLPGGRARSTGITQPACPPSSAAGPRISGRGRPHRGAWLALVSLGAALLTGCGSLPSLEGRTATTAMPAGTGTQLDTAIAPLMAAKPGLTGIHPLHDGREAFAARVALADAAERSLDVQYYIWHGDVSGRLMFEVLRRAADRGIRVRLLLDDNGVWGLDPTIAALDAHANVEVRLFNPFANRTLRLLGYATDFGRLNRRMHNKSFTADGVATIVGGRNVGDEYFAAGDGIGFVDLDVIAIGAVVPQVAESFDNYWNSRSAYPADRIVSAATPADVSALAARGRATLESDAGRGYAASVRQTDFVRRVLQGSLEWDWSEAQLVVDDPAKGLGRAERKDLLMSSFEHVVGSARREAHVVSPYFVPMREGVAAFAGMQRRGVQVSILTNALEATDVTAVHAGYAKRRKALLQSGVRLYELKRSAAAVSASGTRGDPKLQVATGGPGLQGSAPGSGASLHAKTFAVDRERMFVGSFNFDPRSAALNTEMGLVLRSPALANRLADAFRTQIPQASYEVMLAPDGAGLHWIERVDGREVVHTTEPGTTWFRRFLVGVMALLPIEWLL